MIQASGPVGHPYQRPSLAAQRPTKQASSPAWQGWGRQPCLSREPLCVIPMTRRRQRQVDWVLQDLTWQFYGPYFWLNSKECRWQTKVGWSTMLPVNSAKPIACSILKHCSLLLWAQFTFWGSGFGTTDVADVLVYKIHNNVNSASNLTSPAFAIQWPSVRDMSEGTQDSPMEDHTVYTCMLVGGSPLWYMTQHKLLCTQ